MHEPLPHLRTQCGTLWAARPVYGLDTRSCSVIDDELSYINIILVLTLIIVRLHMININVVEPACNASAAPAKQSPCGTVGQGIR